MRSLRPADRPPNAAANLIAVGLLTVVASGSVVAASGDGQSSDRTTPPPTETVPTAETWELRFRPGPMRVHIDPATGRKYWYFTYVVSNRTGRQRTWAPVLELHSDAGFVQVSGRDVPPRVVSELMRKLQVRGGAEILDQNQAIGPIAAGEEHARESVVVWPVEDDRITALSLYVTGLTSRRERLHGFGPEPVELRQTRRLRYLVPGDLDALRDRPVEMVSEDWVYR
jgi:hypothetical protein